MIHSLANVLAPHYCLSCGEIGSVLCEYCKYDIVEDAYQKCIVCGHISPVSSNLCRSCHLPYRTAWCVGERHDTLQSLLDNYKFMRMKSAARVLGGLLDEVIPILPEETIVTYLTTIQSHIRQRGYDHARLIAKDFAKRRGYSFEQTLLRNTNVHQLGASRRQRRENARQTFSTKLSVKNTRYLLIDDIYTTGSTLEYASKALLEGGASEVMVAVIARQPLEK